MLPMSERYIAVKASLNTRLSSHLIVFDMSFFSVVAGGKHQRAETCVTAPVLWLGSEEGWKHFCFSPDIHEVIASFFTCIEQAAQMLLLLFFNTATVTLRSNMLTTFPPFLKGLSEDRRVHWSLATRHTPFYWLHLLASS